MQVVIAVRGKIPVLFDGGLRRGTDVYKALALGAQAVLVRLWISSICTLSISRYNFGIHFYFFLGRLDDQSYTDWQQRAKMGLDKSLKC